MCVSEGNVEGFGFNFHKAFDTFLALLRDCNVEIQSLFSQSYFGQFVGQPKIVRSSTIISYLVLRTGSFNRKPKDGLLIEIGDEVQEFSNKDFQEITFLKVVDGYEEFKLAGVLYGDSLFKKKNSGKYQVNPWGQARTAR